MDQGWLVGVVLAALALELLYLYAHVVHDCGGGDWLQGLVRQ